MQTSLFDINALKLLASLYNPEEEFLISINSKGKIIYIPEKNFLSLQPDINFFETLHLNSKIEDFNKLQEAFINKTTYDFTYALKINNQQIYIHISAISYPFDNNHILFVKNKTHYINTIQSSNERYQLLKAVLATSIDAIIIIDLTGVMIEANPAVSELFGYSKEELIGKNVSMLMPGKYAKHHDLYLQKYVTKGQSKIIGTKRELVAKKKNGDEFPIELSLSEMNHCGSAKFTGIISDISVKKKYEKQILEESAKLMEQNEKLLQLNHEISIRNEEIKAQQEEIIVQRNFAISQKREIEFQKGEIMDSIIYAQRIQNASLPMQVFLDFLFPKHFILFEPKDIVSGDFYWAYKIEDYTLFAVGDCTGHGVPGSFLTILGIAFLNEIAASVSTPDPALILDKLRIKIIKSLHQTDKNSIIADGMDIALCVINEKTRELSFAGANSPAYIFRSSALDFNDGHKSNFIELKGDKMPIGAFLLDNRPYVKHIIKLHEKDMIYIFSDGIKDQIGGPENKKYKTSQFKNFLSQIFCMPVNEQCEMLRNNIRYWRSNKGDDNFNHIQTDDICIMGVRFTFEQVPPHKISNRDYNWEL